MTFQFTDRLFVCVFSLLIIGSTALQAQPVLNARNISLGGGGTAYLSGIEANFYNPANLSIYDRKGTFHFSLASAGTFFEPVLSTGSPRNQFQRYADIFSPFEPGNQSISTAERTTILDENYTGSDLSSEHLSRADMTWGGLQWINNGKAYSLAVRTRVGSRIEVGRGWYSENSIEQNGNSIRDFTLVRQQQVYHEVSFGFSQEFQFLNGLIPRVNQFYIGFAPKFIIGGSYENMAYRGRYLTDTEQNSTDFQSDFSFYSTGSYSEMIKSYRQNRDPFSAISGQLDDRYLLDPTGYGIGIDFGITYLIPLGSSMSLLDKGKDREPIQKSLRLGMSITDIGAIFYSHSPLQISSAQSSSQINNQDPLNIQFIGAAGQVPVFFEEASEIPNPFFGADNESEENFTTSLPTSFNAGMVLDINRVKIMSDLTLGLNNTAFTNKKLVAHFGIESRPLPKLPIRFGTTLAAGKPLRFGAGTGIETRYWDFSISTQVLIKSSTLTSDVVGGAVAALQFHI